MANTTRLATHDSDNSPPATPSGHSEPLTPPQPETSDAPPSHASLTLLQTLKRRLDNDSNHPQQLPAKRIRRVFSHIHIAGPDCPRSAFEGWNSPLPAVAEWEALFDLKAAFPEAQTTDYTYFELNDFSVYRFNGGEHSNELVSLDRLQNRRSCHEFLFDGTLSVGEEQCYVQGVHFKTVTIDGYGDPDLKSLRNHICIQSPAARAGDVWYRLGQPSVEYVRFFEPFKYLAQFAKHFVDYLLDHEDVSLDDFRRDFYAWLFVRYSRESAFKAWLAKCNLQDFRTTVSAHIEFLWKECHSMDNDETRLTKHTVWAEVHPWQLKAIPSQPSTERQTVVTPFAYECFRRSYFAGHLEPRHISDRPTMEAIAERKAALGLLPFAPGVFCPGTGLQTPHNERGDSGIGTCTIRAGDIVSVPPDQQSEWKSAAAVWYAYVQAVRRVAKTSTKLDVLWLYEPKDTTLGNAYYPFSDELFLSDNCSCGADAIDASDVLSKIDVEWGIRDPATSSGFFVRQKFRTVHEDDTYDFVTVRKSDFTCNCSARPSAFLECRQNFGIGETVLFLEYSDKLGEDRLEPAQIVDFLLEQRQVVLRRFERRETSGKSRANELELTKDLFRCPPSKIVRRCHVRSFHPDVVEEGLPTPYNAGGTGDFFYVLDGFDPSASCDFGQSDDGLPPVDAGWDPQAAPPRPKMRGMGIFCGGGNLDRGLEDGGAVEFKYAIDYAEHALFTYRANLGEAAEDVHFFLGSVDDYIAQAMAGVGTPTIAQVGDVDVLAAGSPCPGFSRANKRRNDPLALRNASMVASVVSYVDFYSPSYCILENVLPMTQGMGPKKDEVVFAQILAALVAMGYQAQQFLMDSWASGSSQARTRVFIVASAPGLEPLSIPPHTHSRPRNGQRLGTKSLGRSSNNLPFGVRRDEYTPFEHVSPLQSTCDLPNVGDSLPQLCPMFPDHRVPSEEGNTRRACMTVVPCFPRGMGFVQAIWQGGSSCNDASHSWCSPITGAPLEFFEKRLRHNKYRSGENSRVYSRVNPDALFPTFLTTLHTADAFMGRCLHWDQPRMLSVMEARRGQGYPDHEVIIGSPAQQMRIIGNSVDRKVALALGLVLRESWLKS